MAPDRDIGSVHIDVTTNIETVQTQVEAILKSLGPARIKLIVDKTDATAASKAVVAVAEDTQRQLTAAEKKGVSDRLTIRTKAATEAAALEEREREKRKGERNRENQSEIRAQKDHNRAIALSRERAAQEIARDQEKHAADERKILEQRVSQEAKALQDIDAMTVKSFEERKTLRQKHKIQQQKAISDLADFEIREETKTAEAVRKLKARRVDDALKAKNAIELVEKRHSEAIRQEKRKLESDLERLDAAGKERQARNKFVFDQRELGAQRAQQRQLELIIARSQGKIAAISNKPIGLGILSSFTKINSSLKEFDRVASRVLQTSLLSFTAWSAGVTVAVAAVAAASIASFAKVDLVARRAGAVFASDEFSKNLEAGKQGIFNFEQFAVASSKRVIEASNEVAKTTLFNPREVAEGAKALAQAGFDEANALRELGTVARFAQNEQISMSEATEQLTGGLFAAGLEMNALTSLTDKFTFAANATNATATEVAQAFSNQAAGAFRQYGQSVDEAITVIGLFAKANLRGLEAGTQSAILVREISRSAFVKAPEAWKKYGLAVEDATGKARPITKVLVELNDLLNKTRREDGQGAYQRLRKELDLTERSMRGLTIIAPQLGDLGAEGVARWERELKNAGGATVRQAKVIEQSVSVQFGNMVENIAVAFQSLGARAQGGLKGLFDQVDLLVQRATPALEGIGDQLNVLIEQFTRFLGSAELVEGTEILVDAFKITIVGVKDTVKAFAQAFGEVDSGQSTFVSFAKSVRAFSEAAAVSLPIVARIIGEIIDTLIDNKDAFEVFAKAAVGLFVLRRAFALTVVPLEALAKGFIAAKGAATAFAVSSTAGPIATGLGALATKIGFVDKAALAARNSLIGMQAAAAATSAATAARTAGAASTAGAAGTASAATGATLAANASAKKGFAKLASAEAKTFPILVKELTKASSPFSKILKSVTLIAPKFLKFAGTVGIVIAVIEGAVHAFKGFKDGLDESLGSTEESRRGLAIFAREAKRSLSILKKGFDVLLISLEQFNDTFEFVGKALGRAFGSALNEFGLLVDGFDKLLNGDLLGAFDSFAAAISDAFTNSIKIPAQFVIDTFDGLIERIEKIGKEIGVTGEDMKKFAATIAGPEWTRLGKAFGAKDAFGEAGEFIKGAKDSVKDFRVELFKTQKIEDELGIASVFEKASDAIDDAVSKARELREELNKTTTASLAKATLDSASKTTEGLIDIYKKAASRGPLAAAIRQSLGGISKGTAQKELATLIERSLTEAQASAFSSFEARIGDASRTLTPKITPELNEEAVQTAMAQIDILKQNRQLVIDAKFPKNISGPLIKDINAEIVKIRSFVNKTPIRLVLEIAGSRAGSVGAPFSPKTLMDPFLAPIRAAIKDPTLVKELSEEQRKTYEKAVAGIATGKPLDFGFGGAEQTAADFARTQDNVRLALGQLGMLSLAQKESRIAPKKIEQDFFAYAHAAATGLLLGTEDSVSIAIKAADALAAAYLGTFETALGIDSPSTVMKTEGMFLNQGLADGIKVFSVLPINAALQAGLAVSRMYANGIAINGILPVTAAINVVTNTTKIMGALGFLSALSAGERTMGGFLIGLKKGFGTPAQEGSVAWYLNVFIPQWIKDNKGPVAYDATILVPAGEAVMEGFGRGLRAGFSQIQGFVKEVGPSLKEFISADAFSGRTATIMADIALGRTPDIDAVFDDLRGAVLAGAGGFGGVSDPRLQFLHRTLSLADTQSMAASLVKTFGTTGGIATDRAAGTLTSSGKISDHTYGTAADMGTGGPNPTGASLAMFAAIKPLIGNIFKQIIHAGIGYGEGYSFSDSQHGDHVHAAWLMGEGFDKYSGKIGKPAGFDIPDAPNLIDQAINAASKATGVVPQLLAAMAKQESGFNPRAGSSAGAQGLMQLMPATAASLGVRDILDPFQNALGGARYIKQQLNTFGTLDKALAAYNAGPGAVRDFGGVPPFSETRHYVDIVKKYFAQYGGTGVFGGFREHGGPVSANTPYIVGERGPELMMPRTNGTVINARDTAAMMNGQMGSSKTVNNTINLQTQAASPAAILGYLRAHTQGEIATLVGS